jgi:hypothetical protein
MIPAAGKVLMTRWEYADAVHKPDLSELTIHTPDAEPTSYPAGQWGQVLAQLGAQGWELVGCTAHADGARTFHFKREADDAE